ncbi:putative nuclease HARBI1 [Dreissena polymorpha]|uniref:putative nuclease HARBI1 n=1 Tax=Dreissena polymorpha TaxID=45954 RepID=UPI00226564C9|nr:putative nuclease HARBI1 [Dreissena polymorpha]
MADFDIPNARRPRQFRRIDRFTETDDPEEIRRRFRFTHYSIDRIERLIGHRLERPTGRNQPLTPRQQILITLRFFASGNFLQLIGDTFGVDIATVSRVVTRVTDELCDLKDQTIKFPTTDRHKSIIKQNFFKIAGFPSVIAAIDGTHVRIIAPHEHEEQYVNRKHYHSVNVQATCDHRGVFTSINATWPGSTHDAHVFRTSVLSDYLEAHHHGLEDGIVLGDSAYPCRKFLMTPYLHPAQMFNDAHAKTRNVIERAFGVLKRRFHVLHGEAWGEREAFPEEEDPQPPPLVQLEGNPDGQAIRDAITANIMTMCNKFVKNS